MAGPVPRAVGLEHALPSGQRSIEHLIRWEYHVENFFGMVRLGCMQILFRYL